MTTASYETRVLLLRHAETAAPQRFHGAESDIGLSERGKAQAEEVAETLSRIPFEALYCSGMQRAKETAAPIARKTGIKAEVLELLHERKLGPLSGQLHEDSWSIYTEAAERWKSGQLGYTHEGGESYAAIRDRIVPVFRSLGGRHLDQTIVVVAHGVVIRVLLTSLIEELEPRDFDKIGIENVAINDLRWDGSRWYRVDFPRG